MSKSEIKAHATTYVNTYTIQIQNNDQLYHCLKNSLTASENSKIIVERSKYHIGSNTCGYLLFKLIPHKAIIETGTRSPNMRDNLASLHTYITTVNSNSQRFKKYAKIKYEALTAICDGFDNMMSNLIKVYLASLDKQFLSYIQQKKDK